MSKSTGDQNKSVNSASRSHSGSTSIPIGAGWDTRTNPHIPDPEPESESAPSTSRISNQPVKETEYSSRARKLLSKVRGRKGFSDPSSFFDPEEEDPSTKRRLKASKNAASKVAAFGAGNPSQEPRIAKSVKSKSKVGEKEAAKDEIAAKGKGKGKQRQLDESVLDETAISDLASKRSDRVGIVTKVSNRSLEASVESQSQAQEASEGSNIISPITSTHSPPATPPPPSKRKRGRSPNQTSSKVQSRGKGKALQKDKVEPLTEGQVMGLQDAEGTPPPLARDFPWPEHFLQLEKTFKVSSPRRLWCSSVLCRSLQSKSVLSLTLSHLFPLLKQAVNTVYAFCQARKHMATTFDTMKSSVEGLIKRELSIFDLAQIKSLCPDLIRLAYVDQDSLDVTLDGNRSESFDKAKEKYDPDKNLYRKNGRRGEPKVDVYEQAMAAMETGKGLHFPGRRDFGPSGAFNPENQSNLSMARSLSSSSISGGGWRDDSQPVDGLEEDEFEEELQSLLPSADIKDPSSLEKRRDEYVLLFEFNDGTVQGGPKATARGANRARMRRGPNRNEKK